MSASYEIRVMRLNESPDAPTMTSPDDAAAYWQSVIARMPWFIQDREVCVAVTLNTRLRATGHSLVSIGTLDFDHDTLTVGGTTYSLKSLGEVRPVIDAGGLFNYARQSGMIAAKQ